MARTIIFISGFLVPCSLAKSFMIWDDSHWQDYNRIYLDSKTPTSDKMVVKEIAQLSKLINQFPDVIVAGQSLGAWWAANLACSRESKIKKLVLWTPLSDAAAYPIFNVSDRHYPVYKAPSGHSVGPHKTLVLSAKRDLLVPRKWHSTPLIKLFDATHYSLDGGHYYQTNHKAALHFTKDWIELD